MDLDQMTADDHEALLRLLTGEMRDLIRDDRLSPEDRLVALERVLTTAVGDSPEAARDLARDLVLGVVEP